MAKTIKQMLELYKPKAADEQKFVDKHVVAKTDDVNGNKDDVFNGTNVKTIDRKKTRKGYNAGEDEKVYESIEDYTLEEIEEFMQTEEYAQLDELSKTTLGKYIRKAASDVGHRSVAASQSAHHALDARERAKNPKLAFAKSGNLAIAKMHANKMDTHISKTVSRKEGIAKAVSRLTKESVEQIVEKLVGKQHKIDKNKNNKIDAQDFKLLRKEEIEQVDEKMAPGADAGKYIKDFEQSDAPQFKGKSKEKRRQMAIAAYMSQKNEEVEHIEEKLVGKQHKIDKNKNNKIDAQDFKLLRKEEVEQINEGEEAHAQFTKYHGDTASLLKKIHSGLSNHYSNVTNKKNYNNGMAGWHHVDTIKEIHRNLQDLHDRVLQNVEYSAPPKPLKVVKEEVEVSDTDVKLLSLYVNLDEENRASMVQMVEEGRKEELIAFAETLGAE